MIVLTTFTKMNKRLQSYLTKRPATFFKNNSVNCGQSPLTEKEKNLQENKISV